MKLFAGAGSGTVHFPEALFPMEGFRGIHDAPKVRVLALECGQKAALVSVELVMLPPELVDAVKSIVAAHTQTPKENIWVHTTHAITTPHAPHAPMGPGGVALPIDEAAKEELESKSALYAAALRDAVTEAAEAAGRDFRPGKMGLGQAVSHISINRDVQTPYGWWIGRNPEGKTDPNYDLLRFDGAEGKCIATVFVGGLKPCAIDNSQMRENERLVSSDVPGLVCRLIEAETGAPCLFFMGAAGDQVPAEQTLLEEVQEDGTVNVIDLGVEKGLEMVDRQGRAMARALLPAIAGIRCEAQETQIRHASTCFSWGGKGRIPMQPRKCVEFTYERDVRIDAKVMLLGELALVGLKPEVNCITAQELAEKSPYGKTVLISMVDGGQKYMPDAKSYENITWEAQNSMLMPGAAEAWVAAVCEKLTQMKEAQ